MLGVLKERASVAGGLCRPQIVAMQSHDHGTRPNDGISRILWRTRA